MNKNFDFAQKEAEHFSSWKAKGYFTADPTSSKEPFCMVIPPPNVTGRLHMGHALVNTLQDIQARYRRMCGYEVLWLPGTDHAGIATQTVVERHLIATEKKRRTDYTREEFLQKIWQWKDEHEGVIISQLQKLGCSCDWSRLRFTMDAGCNKAVNEAFKNLYDRGLIEQDNYLVNWDPVTQTALADDEVDYEERAGFLWHIRYPFEDHSGHLIVATTRPETMLADVAVAVHPDDPRYKAIHGKMLRLPLTNRLIPVICDSFVDESFGSGCVKITPGHDPVDYEVGLRHKLPLISMLESNGTVSKTVSEQFGGLFVDAARQAVASELKKMGLIEKTVPHTRRVGISYRSKAVIEPFLSKQWFLRMSTFRPILRQAVESGSVNLIPASWKNTYYHWIDNLRDWCISRQLWWGHQIPVWYKGAEKICSETAPGPSWTQDKDVLDTWFSSALWPFSGLGWPAKTPEMQKFFPNSLLITGHDILFFWVARMILMSHAQTKSFPFPNVFVHGLIYGKSYWKENNDGTIAYISGDEKRAYDAGKDLPPDVFSKWEKMSKSKGNVIDPIEMIEQYGCDSVRMALASTPSQLRQIDLDSRRFEEWRNFSNKVWNSARFCATHLPKDASVLQVPLDDIACEDRWILARLSQTITQVRQSLEKTAFDTAAQAAYDFFWNDFCSHYIECAKPTLFGKRGTPITLAQKQKILAIVFFASLRLLAPMAPFITEELFVSLKLSFSVQVFTDPWTKDLVDALKAPSLCVAPFPHAFDTHSDTVFDAVVAIVIAIRRMRGELKIPLTEKPRVFLSGNGAFVEENRHIVEALVRIGEIEYCETIPTNLVQETVGAVTVAVEIPQAAVDVERLKKDRDKLLQSQERLRSQLTNPDFLAKAPAQLVEKQKAQLETIERDLTVLLSQIQSA